MVGQVGKVCDVKGLFVTVLAVLSCIAAPAGAQSLQLSPAQPTVMDTVYARIGMSIQGSPTWDSTGTRVSMSNNRITVHLRLEPPAFELTPGSGPPVIEVPLGRLPEGRYTVELAITALDRFQVPAVAPLEFDVAAKSGPQPLVDYTDIWWNPIESGWGLNIVQHPSGQLFVTWCQYDASGNPAWYVVPGGKWATRDTFEGTIYRTTGPRLVGCGLLGCRFLPSAVTRAPVGTLGLGFSHFLASQVTATFSLPEGTITRTLERQGF